MRITVIRSVPPVIIGSVGIIPNHEFEAFEARLDAAEERGVIVERLQPEEIAGAIADRPALEELKYPTNTEWAHALGAGRRAEEPSPTR